MKAPQVAEMPANDARWYRMPIAWLGVAVFALSVAGCIGVIIMATRYSDEPLPVNAERVLKVPTSKPADS